MSLGDSIGSSLGRAIGAALSGGGWSPLSLFQSGEQGTWYDPSDFSTMFQDSAGATPVTAVDQPVGLILDKRLGLVRGAELITNGTFDTSISGWSADAGSSISWNAGTIVCVSSATTNILTYQNISTVAGQWYEVTVDRIASGSTMAIYVGTSVGAANLVNSGFTSGLAPIRAVFRATGATSVVQFAGPGANATGTLDNASVKAIPGNHAYQSTSANRPILRGTPIGANLVTNGDFATAANWTPGAGWAIGSGVATATASSAALTHTLAATSGRVYRVRYTMTRSAGTLTPSFGGVTLTARSASDTYEEWITASSTAALVFTAAAFTGTLDDVVIHDCSADVVSAPYGLQMGTIAGVDRWMQTAAVFAHDSDWSVCVGIRSYAFADGVYPYGVATVRGGTTDTEGFILAVASGASVRTRAYATETGFTKTLSAATPYVLLAAKQQSAHVRTAWVSGQIEESDASAFSTTPAATSNQSARFGLNYSTQFMPMIWYGGVLIGRELNTSEKAQLRQWVSARTPGTTL